MPDDPRVRELLDDLLDRDSTPEEVCRPYPGLLSVVRTRFQQIRRARAQLDRLLPVQSPVDGLTPDFESQLLPRLPAYEIESVLGEGGMGIVFRARHLKLCRHVALKMSRAGCYGSEHDQERFRREAESVAALRHPNVVQIYDVGELEGRPFYTMELMEGGSLSQKQAGIPQTAKEAAALVATLAEAVHAAHQGGIIHRDLKPANILFTPDGTPKITDFGLARRLEAGAGLTLSGVPVGTPSYMAPEQARGRSRDIGPAVDVYALGAILYELLTGRPPFRGETSTETLLQVMHQEPVPPSRFNPKVPRDLQTICLTCLQKEPRLRYVTAAAMADDLQRFQRGEPIAARSEVYLSRWVRRICRQPVLSTAIAMAALSTLGIAAGGLWLMSDRSAKARAAHDDVLEMRRCLGKSAWVEAAAARDRASGRLGSSSPADLRRLIDCGSRDLELAARLEAFHARGVEAFGGGVHFADYHTGLMDAFRSAGLGTTSDAAATMARHVRESDIRTALIDVLDWYAFIAHSSKDRSHAVWALNVARDADPDQSAWRRQARDPDILMDSAARERLIAARPEADPSRIPSVAMELHVSDDKIPVSDRLALMRQLYQTRPGDFWLNVRLGALLSKIRKDSEALGYLQTATSLRPGSAIAHFVFGNALQQLGRDEEAVEQWTLAVELDPKTKVFQQAYAGRMSAIRDHVTRKEQLHRVLRADAGAAFAHTQLGQIAATEGRETDAIASLTRAVDADPLRLESQKALRDYWLTRGRLDEVQVAWQAAVEKRPPQYTAWYGYPELCLFLGKEDEYRRVRRELLSRYRSTNEARIAETISRTALLLPATGDDLAMAVALSQRAADSSSAAAGGYRAYFLFARGLAEYRQGKFDEAVATMRGEAARVLGPAPRLVLAMALHRQGLEHEALLTLGAAATGHEWRINHCRNQDAWIFHILRREAEQMILPNLQAFLAGTHQPTENDERLALVGICQATDRSLALARIYEDAFAAAPELTAPTDRHRYEAARAAARVGCGLGSDLSAVEESERSRWRVQAVRWLREELAAVTQSLAGAKEASRAQALQRLRQWESEADFAGVRELAAMQQLPSEERENCRALWTELRTILIPR